LQATFNDRDSGAMPIYRVSQPDSDQGIDAVSIDDAEEVIRSVGSGRYQIDEISRDSGPSGHTSRRWGVGIKHANGAVTLDPDPWPDR
jgi:hypothetical protein